uniref:hypothetical protein n=1 Tax=Ensifer adhaerens TaxID=106592 RepID=UPI003F491FAA
MVKPRENRVPIMMSDDELKAIDDWRFNNRIATRSDAVRKLAKIGMVTDEWIIDAERFVETALDIYLTKFAKLADASEANREPVKELYDALILVYVEVLKVTRAAHVLREIADVDAAIAEADYRVDVAREEKVRLYEEWFGVDRKDGP